MSDFGVGGRRCLHRAALRRRPTDVTSGDKGSFTSLAWRGGRLIGACHAARIDRRVATLDPDAAAVTSLDAAAETPAAGGRPCRADVERRHGGRRHRRTSPRPRTSRRPARPWPRDHPRQRRPAAPGPARSVAWRSDGFDVQGWLLAPLAPAAGASIRWWSRSTAARAPPRHRTLAPRGSAVALLASAATCLHAQSARQLRPGRGLHPRQRARLRRRRPARHPGGRRRGREAPRSTTAGSASTATAMAAS